MRQNALTIALIAVVLLVLVGLNAIFMAQGNAETEQSGNRSSYKGTRYGTLAYFTLLKELGYSVSRLEVPYTELEARHVETLVIVMPSSEHQPSGEEIEALESWVRAGGRAVIADRDIRLDFADPKVSVTTKHTSGEQVRAVAPSPVTRGVRDVSVTPFAETLSFEPDVAAAHVAGDRGPVVADMKFGDGRITFVSETHMLENGGIAEADNMRLALNVVEGVGGPGRIAFDEYHHGYGASSGNQAGGLREYIAGTPVPWILAQLLLVAVVVAYGVGRRFGRPVPLATERRTSALEFVSSMANIQRLARASDLAVENIYAPFRARLCRYANLPNTAPTELVATTAARRARVNKDPLQAMMRRCEEVLAGGGASPEELVTLVRTIRDYESRLALKR